METEITYAHWVWMLGIREGKSVRIRGTQVG
jgi:hypothetical protein